MSTRLVAHRPHATFRWNHLAQVGQVGGGRSLTRYAVIVLNIGETVRQEGHTRIREKSIFYGVKSSQSEPLAIKFVEKNDIGDVDAKFLRELY